VTIPLMAYRSVPAGKPVIDTGSYSPARDGQFPELDNGATYDCA
jgi:8-hydroxy-5-deazaflavin:NADPH oxidoreductase